MKKNSVPSPWQKTEESELPEVFKTKEHWEAWRKDIIDKIFDIDKGHRWKRSQLESFTVHELSNIYNFISRHGSSTGARRSPWR